MASNLITVASNILAAYIKDIVQRTLLGAPGIATSNKKLLVTKGIATRSKDATRGSWHRY